MRWQRLPVVREDTVNFEMKFGLLNAPPLLRDYCERITARPAFQRAIERDAQK